MTEKMVKGESFMPKITVIVPIYNSVRFIRECVDSIVGQTWKDMEILLVDAGSTDGTVEILQEYCKNDPRIRLLHSEKKSMGHQYNLGIDQATGKYVGFVESDDYIAPTMYKTLLQVMETHEIDYVKSDFDLFVEKESRLFLRQKMLGSSMKELYGRAFEPRNHIEFVLSDIFMWNGLYRRDFLQRNQVRLNETPKAAAQDIDFGLQVFCAANRIMYVECESYKYRKDNVASSSYSPMAVKHVVQEMEYVRDWLLPRYEKDATLLAGMCWRCWNMFYAFYGRISELVTPGQDMKSYAERFRVAFLDVYRNIPYPISNRLGLEASCQPVVSGSILEEGYQKVSGEPYQRMQRLWDYIKRYERVVIFGAGVQGSCWCGLLKNNDFQGEIFLCDNSFGKWGTYVLGSAVLSPNEAMKFGRGTIYLIANEAHWKEIFQQLLDGGVQEQDICRIIPWGPIGAFEIHLQ